MQAGLASIRSNDDEYSIIITHNPNDLDSPNLTSERARRGMCEGSRLDRLDRLLILHSYRQTHFQ